MKKRADVFMENGEICEASIPDFSLNEGDRGVTVIEDHTIVMCGGEKTNGDGMTFKLFTVAAHVRVKPQLFGCLIDANEQQRTLNFESHVSD